VISVAQSRGAAAVARALLFSAFTGLMAFAFAAAVFVSAWWAAKSVVVALVISAVLLAAAASAPWQRAAVDWAGRAAARCEPFASARGLAIIIAIGAAVRVVWVWLVPPVQLSDMGAYFALGRALSRGAEYVVSRDRAFWPPGLPLTLAPTMRLFGTHQWVPAINNIVLFALTAVLLFKLVSRVSGRPWGALAVALAAAWPNWIFLSGLASKELLFAALLLAAVSLHTGPSTNMAKAGAVGVLTGAMALTQPSAQMLPLVFVFIDWVRRLRGGLIARRAAVLIAAMIAVVAPWTLRNYAVLHHFVPVSDNGGITLWVGNNPDASGQFVPVPNRLAQLPELDRARIGRAEAVAWMRAHPARVAELALRKQVLFWGDDAKGAYETVKRPERYGNGVYAALKSFCNVFWIGIVGALFVAARRGKPLSEDGSLVTAAIVCSVAYFAAFQLVFEGDGRFHTPLMPLFLVALVCGMASAQSRADTASSVAHSL
jgi:hypothetical protein